MMAVTCTGTVVFLPRSVAVPTLYDRRKPQRVTSGGRHPPEQGAGLGGGGGGGCGGVAGGGGLGGVDQVLGEGGGAAGGDPDHVGQVLAEEAAAAGPVGGELGGLGDQGQGGDLVAAGALDQGRVDQGRD